MPLPLLIQIFRIPRNWWCCSVKVCGMRALAQRMPAPFWPGAACATGISICLQPQLKQDDSLDTPVPSITRGVSVNCV